MVDENVIDSLFLEGKKYFQDGNFYDAHESWEDLWSDYYVMDHKFIQGLIQLSVSFFHLQNANLKGAKSLMKKCLQKFELFDGTQRGINVTLLKTRLQQVQKEYHTITNTDEFNWSLVPDLDA